MKQTDDSFSQMEAPADLETRLERLIDDLAKKEKQSEDKKRQLRRWIGGMAASITLLLSIGFFINSNRRGTDQALIQENNALHEQELACLEAQKALILVSLNFNKGMDRLTLAVSKIEKSNNVINKTFNK